MGIGLTMQFETMQSTKQSVVIGSTSMGTTRAREARFSRIRMDGWMDGWMTERMEVHDLLLANEHHSVGSRRMNDPPYKSGGGWEHS